jgi:hypothetical protein
MNYVESIDHKWGELDCDATVANETTRRLALCNMDWDHITAEDIMLILASFLPTGGHIKAVHVSTYSSVLKFFVLCLLH